MVSNKKQVQFVCIYNTITKGGMKMKLRKIMAVLLCAALVAGFCVIPASAYDVTEINVNIWDNNQLAGLQQIADEWTATSGVKVNINVIGWD